MAQISSRAHNYLQVLISKSLVHILKILLTIQNYCWIQLDERVLAQNLSAQMSSLARSLFAVASLWPLPCSSQARHATIL
jgi:hypothetical protein